MAITKKLTEIFRRYLPDDETRRILDAGHDLSLRMHPSKESPERVEIEMTFDFHVEDSFLHRVEADLRQCYGLRSVWIFPHFPPQKTNSLYIISNVVQNCNTFFNIFCAIGFIIALFKSKFP